ncbi:efflux RND transporter permease subunit [Extibacter muris]|uniref:efflux RND transporter permease subunit n=1 Tax=Extibacter muris TaxID=1796622 RepID=UPI001D067210|nr:efflux RND transporter permease subunit [Extibacter muris]MCB6200702.1 efflux RND transporter permease subunit [Extibacter muris]MCQ4665613.1 efflux RND transporter permease subunit [Extibacter muris]MCQ4691779.1 efflux RND transporter permease subunit [Extibacter muris]
MLSKFSVKRPYTVVVGVVLIIILGIVSFGNMTVDLLPSMNLPYAMVMTTYPGASPEEVETVVTKPVEQTMATVSNIKNVQSVSNENASTVILEFDQTANMDSVTIEMREGLDQISGFWPDEVTNPIIMKLNPSMMPVLIAAVSADGEDAAETTRIIEEQILPEVESVEGVASVSTAGSIEETVQITVNEQKIEDLNEEVKAELEKKMNEAASALQAAKDQVETGKAALAAGKAQASSGMGAAESQISQKAEEIKQAQLEITEKMAELNVTDTQLQQSLATIQSSKAAAEAQLTQLKTLKASYDQMKKRYDELDAKGGGGRTPAEQAEFDQLDKQLKQMQPQITNYDTAKAALEATITQLSEQETSLKEGQGQVTAGKQQLEALQKQVNDGAMTLAQARGQLASAQVEAAAGLGEGAAQLAAGEAMIQSQEAQMEAAKGEASANADISNMLNADMVKTLLAAENFSMPAGYVTEEGLDYLVRVGDKFKSIEDIKDLVLINMDGINPVKLTDVANVELADNSDETYAKINGKPGMMLSIQKQTGYSTGDVSDRVLEKLERLQKEHKEIKAVTLMDQGVYIDLIVNSVLENLVYGAVLAIIILLVFLKSFRPTFVIACSIPISIMTALVAMYFSGVTLNIISLSGLALGVGMLVDNSIVVIENIYRMRNEEGASAKTAAIEGARQVGGAITASTLTTICVFLPIVFATGITRQLFVDMGLTIAYSLLASLAIALTLVPMISAGLLRKTEEKESRLFIRIKDWYGRLLARALHKKPLVLIGALVLFVASGALAISRGTEFMPQMESTEISMTLETEKGTSLEDTAIAADKVMDRVGKLKDVKDIGAMVSSSNMMGTSTATNVVEFYAITKDKPSLSNNELKKEIEKVTKGLGGELTVNMSNMDMSALGSSGINVQIKGKDLDKLQKIAGDIKSMLIDIKGTQNVTDGTEDNKEELRVIVDKTKATEHGLTVAQVYQSLNKRLSEAQSATSLSTDAQDYDIYVVDDADESLTRKDIRELTVTAEKQDGTTEEVRLSDIATFEDASGLQAISRKDQSRYMSVTSEIKDGDNIGLVSSRVNKALQSYDVPEGYEVKMVGEDETINESMVELFKMLGLALVFMYLIMVAQFQSLRSPFIVMFTVPLAFTGGLLGLWIAGKAVSVIAMVGFVMLSGIIVNNGIVFIDYTNQLIAGGLARHEALVEAGRTRLRPIVMTALTTILGLSTLAIGVGMGADMVQPMAIVTIGGLIYGTILTLVVVPCIFDLFHKKEKARLREEMEEDAETAEP